MEQLELNGRRSTVTYLGDGVYGVWDGYNFLLRLGDHRNEDGEIVLEPPVMESFITFIKQCNQLREEYERKESENLASTDDS